MSDEEKRLFYFFQKAQHALIHGTWDENTKSVFTGLDGLTYAEEQQGSTPLETLTLDAYKNQQPIVPQELQPVSEKHPSNKPAESCLKKTVIAPTHETVSEKVFDISPSLVVGNSGVTLRSKPIRLASADLFDNAQESLYYQH
ncbi:hypothetical protein DSO57_1032868 [Entomophthora muscae]|uniref:Uncharacterized protein n=1 Tax=Entomophthora muscae TaxID=34485 RepID=A0ACC2TZC8_9FUNG|nr:hypothetical protein DSO57_1032868 [Entomophthora muscae]